MNLNANFIDKCWYREYYFQGEYNSQPTRATDTGNFNSVGSKSTDHHGIERTYTKIAEMIKYYLIFIHLINICSKNNEK